MPGETKYIPLFSSRKCKLWLILGLASQGFSFFTFLQDILFPTISRIQTQCNAVKSSGQRENIITYWLIRVISNNVLTSKFCEPWINMTLFLLFALLIIRIKHKESSAEK